MIAAARHRFATEGLTASLRDIAQDAEVNLGLVHRHFGSKDALIRAVFADAAESGRRLIASAPSFDVAFDALLHSVENGDDAYSRMLALMLLGGVDPHELQEQFPTITRLRELGGEERRDVVALGLLATLAWPVFREHVALAAGYDAPSEAFAALAGVLQRLAAGPDAR